MKILIVSSSDIEGGAARAAYRLHRSLIFQGLEVDMLVQSRDSDDYTVHGPASKVQKVISRLRPFLDSLPVRSYKKRTATLFSPAWVPFGGVVDRINRLNPDVVHLHWIAGGMLRIEDLVRIEAPIIWSLHDMWPFTGGCHYDEECGEFKQSCGNCPVLQSRKDNDLSRSVFLRKVRSFNKKKNITVVGVSQWLANEAALSVAFSGHRVVSLPNPIDTKVFAPFDRAQARYLLNLPCDSKLVLFGAMNATSDPRKGFEELSQALNGLPDDIELVVFGSGRPLAGGSFKQRSHFLGRLHDDVALRLLYSAVDVMVVPSKQEAFGQTASESMACGTPVVAYATTGLWI
ncbi:glycosyltransferase [Pseudomonas sp. MAFF 302030]|uniref:Glycosyltransferase n=1 Tax=Pseudomonas morbosilactucae TaxID=2938197 RepID=A0A9X2CA75_9PSED|nr:glycosyltransferase [Pseudomonas morbosilactucae]MCK9801669.1 glycosyltransferase [Pseudomonas morbosilactucae]